MANVIYFAAIFVLHSVDTFILILYKLGRRATRSVIFFSEARAGLWEKKLIYMYVCKFNIEYFNLVFNVPFNMRFWWIN